MSADQINFKKFNERVERSRAFFPDLDVVGETKASVFKSK